MAVDKHPTSYGDVSSPANDAVAVTPADATEITLTRGLYVGGAGNIVATMRSGNDCTFTAVPAGTILPLRVTKVKATGTTATSIVALY